MEPGNNPVSSLNSTMGSCYIKNKQTMAIADNGAIRTNFSLLKGINLQAARAIFSPNSSL
uniref:Uncharacterized protein n=1 Tax=Anguilla anguilla TaxID=7936 RepID=A0A0E9W8F1_ANGAN